MRFTSARNNYTVSWHDRGDSLALRLDFNNYQVLLPDNVLAYDTAASPRRPRCSAMRGGSRGDNSIVGRGGGCRPGDRTIPGAFSNMDITLGQHGGAPQHGVVHMLANHAVVFRDMRSRPASNQPFTLDDLQTNLTNLTAPKAQAVGTHKVVSQNNGNYALHGVSQTIHALLVVTPTGRVVTCYDARVLSGMKNTSTILREWR
ncbi:MAG: hypothetical protein R3F60_24260 [bacterium]